MRFKKNYNWDQKFTNGTMEKFDFHFDALFIYPSRNYYLAWSKKIVQMDKDRISGRLYQLAIDKNGEEK